MSETTTEAGGGAPAQFEPKIVAFFCNWCTYLAADLAGTTRLKYAPNIRVVRLMCSGRIDPQFVLDAFVKGADGVLIGGCHPGDCHYESGNYKTLRRFHLLRRMLRDLGIEDERGYCRRQTASSRRSITNCSLKIGNCTVTRGSSANFPGGLSELARFLRFL